MKTRSNFLLLLACIHLYGSIEKPPVAIDDHAEGLAGFTIRVNVMVNDYCQEGHHMILKFAKAQHAPVSIEDSCIVYESSALFCGTDTVWYMLLDLDNNLFSEKGYLFIDVANESFSTIGTNNIQALINGWGNHFYNYWTCGGGQFFVPRISTLSTVYAFALWFCGTDPSGNLHLAADGYQQKKADFWTGPVADCYDSSYQVRWNRVWKVTERQIEEHRAGWWKDNYIIPETIAGWPAHGDTTNGEAFFLAPFEDTDLNGIYEPQKGDYPSIRGDEAVFFIYNDDRGDHRYSNGSALELEIHGLAYAYCCPENAAVNNALYFHYDFYNRSSMSYSDSYIGVFCDLGIGNPLDDHIGCDVGKNSMYVFNGDPFDEDNFLPGYGECPPAQSVTILAGPWMDADGLDNPDKDLAGDFFCGPGINGTGFNDGITDNERMGMGKFFGRSAASWQGGFYEPQKFERTLKGSWPDGKPMSYGGEGHPLHGAVGPECNYMFPGNSDPWNLGTACQPPNDGYNNPGRYWTETQEQIPPGDRYGIASMGPFTFGPGEKQETDIAMIFSRDDIPSGPEPSVSLLLEYIDEIISLYKLDSVPQCCDQSAGMPEAGSSNPVGPVIYPNPARDVIHVNITENNALVRIRLTDLSGRLVSTHYPATNRGITLELGGLPPGIYLLLIDMDSGCAARKFIRL